MKKLNNKGMTTIEVILCFVIVIIISVSMFSTVSSFREKEEVESVKEELLTYNNLLMKEIEDDFIKRRLSNIDNIDIQIETENDGATNIYTVHLIFDDGAHKTLKITKQTSPDVTLTDHCTTPPIHDSYKVEYGMDGDLIEYVVPDVGSSILCSSKILDLQMATVFVEKNITESYFKLQINYSYPGVGFKSKYNLNIIYPIGIG